MFVNLTPHVLNIKTVSGEMMEVPPSGTVARVQTELRQVWEVNEVPIYKAHYGEVVGLPEPQQGVLYIVSGMVAAAIQRDDVYSPGELIRDSEGKPIGADGLKASK